MTVYTGQAAAAAEGKCPPGGGTYYRCGNGFVGCCSGAPPCDGDLICEDTMDDQDDDVADGDDDDEQTSNDPTVDRFMTIGHPTTDRFATIADPTTAEDTGTETTLTITPFITTEGTIMVTATTEMTDIIATTTTSRSTQKATSGVLPPVTAGGRSSTITDGTVTDSTFVTSILSTTDSTGGLAVITETTLAPLPTNPPQDGNGNDSDNGEAITPAPTTVIAGATAGGVLAAIAAFLALFFVIRRRRSKKRTASTRPRSPDRYEPKDVADQSQSVSTGDTGECDVFAPFGGRVNSRNNAVIPNTCRPQDANKDEADWPLRPSPISSTAATATPATRHASPITLPNHSEEAGAPAPAPAPVTAPAAATVGNPASPAPAPHPACIELDSASTARTPAPFVPSPVSPVFATSTRQHHQRQNQNQAQTQRQPQHQHPSQLTPGLRLDDADTLSSPARGQQQGQGRYRPDSGGASLGTHRGTLNATAAERERNEHVTSWAQL